MSENKPPKNPLFQSKKLWIGIVSVLIPVINQIPGLNLTVDSVISILAPLFAYMVGQGLADAGKHREGATLATEGKPFWQSKKLVSAILGSVVLAVMAILQNNGYEINPDLLYGIAGAVSFYITGQGLADWRKTTKVEPAGG